MSHAKTYEKISVLLGDGFKIHEGALADISFRGNISAFSVFLENVKNLSEYERPHLHGLFAEQKNETQVLTVILGFGKEFPGVILFVESARGELLPSLSRAWPYAKWWEQESEIFGSVKFENISGPGGALWQLS